MLSEHLTHQKIVNHTAGLGERGELEFIRNVRHIQGEFTLFHGITNTLRYGDFSFINLKTFRVTQIGELKTKYIDDKTIELSITLIRKVKSKVSDAEVFPEVEMAKSRQERQILGISKLMSAPTQDRSHSAKLINESYNKELENLVSRTRAHSSSILKVSPGLAFSCLKFSRRSLYRRIFFRAASHLLEKSTDEIRKTAVELIKPSSNANGLIVDQLLYNPDFSDKNTPGTVPLFWHHINDSLLKDLYFSDVLVVPIFNPAYLIDAIEEMGFKVESNYRTKRTWYGPNIGFVQNFDLFISYVMNFLMTEDFVVNSIQQVLGTDFGEKKSKISVRPQQRIDIIRALKK